MLVELPRSHDAPVNLDGKTSRPTSYHGRAEDELAQVPKATAGARVALQAGEDFYVVCHQSISMPSVFV